MSCLTQGMVDLQRDGPRVKIYFSAPSEIEKKLKEEGKAVPPPIECEALIDTGASHCVVQEDTPPRLGLNPVGEASITTPSHGAYRCYVYFLKMTIPVQNITYEGVFTAVPHLISQNIHSLIGRDLLSKGILIYLGYANQFTLSF